MSYLFGESQVYRLDIQTGYFIPIQIKTDIFEGRVDSEKTAFADFNTYLRSLNPSPKIFELVYVPYGGRYDPTIKEGIKGIQPTLLLKWKERPLMRRKLNWLVWEVDEKGNKLKEFGYFFYIP